MKTHRSYNRNNVGYESTKLDRLAKIIDQIMNFFISDFKTVVKPIQEVR